MDNLDNIIEGILFVAGDGISENDIAEKLQVEIVEVETAVNNLKQRLIDSKSGIQLIKYNDKIQLCSNKDYKTQIEEVLNPIKEKLLTNKVLEVCAIIAYKQPITRIEVENIRGLNSDYAIDVLLDNNLIEVVGRKDAVGKPILFGTTDNFLRKFGLSTISDLPNYDELIGRIKKLHEKTEDNSLFDFNNSFEESKEEDLSEEEQEQLLEDLKNLSNMDFDNEDIV